MLKEMLNTIKTILNYSFKLGEKVEISVGDILLVVVVLTVTRFTLKLFEKIAKKRLEDENKSKFNTVFSFGRWLIYIIIFLVTLDSTGVNVNAILAASAALLIGIGLALQTWFQDIMTGIFIILDKSVLVGDIIELDGKVGRVEEIKLRTTRAVTIDNKVLVIPNHLYLTSSLYNWTQNGKTTRESVKVGVAYGSDVELVKKILIQAADEHPMVLKNPPPLVLFSDFGESSLNFTLVFTLNDSFKAVIPQSDIRFKIDELFREHNITIPFPQRDLHIIDKSV